MYEEEIENTSRKAVEAAVGAVNDKNVVIIDGLNKNLTTALQELNTATSIAWGTGGALAVSLIVWITYILIGP